MQPQQNDQTTPKGGWAPQDISQDGVWIKRSAADKRINGLRLLVLLLNIIMWAAIIVPVVFK